MTTVAVALTHPVRLRAPGAYVGAAGVVGALLGAASAGAARAASGTSVVTWELVQNTSIAVALCVAGGLLVGIAPARPVGAVLLISGTASALIVLLYGSAELVAATTGSVPLALELVSESLWPIAVLPLLIYLPLIYPDGPGDGRRWTLLTVLVAATCATAVAATALGPGIPTGGGILRNPVALPAVAEGLTTVSVVLTVGLILTGFVVLVARTVRGDPLTRRRIALVALTLVLGVGFNAAGPLMPDAVFQTGMTVFPLLLVTAIVVAVWRYRLYDVAVVLNRVAAYLTLTVLLGAVFGTVYLLGLVLLLREPLNLEPWTAVLLAVVAALLCVEPIRQRIQRRLERALVGERSVPHLAIDRIHSAATETDDDRVHETLLRALLASVKSPAGSLELERDLDGVHTVTVGEVGAEPVILPLVHRRELLGRLTIARRSPRETYSNRDLALLDQLAPYASAAIAALRSDQDVARARRDAAGEAATAREQLGRDLHDGLGPLLAGAGLAADALRRRLPDGSEEESEAALLADQLRTAAQRTREFAHLLEPTGLPAGGLAAALRSHLTLVSRAEVPVDLEIRAEDPPAAVAAVAYLLVLEGVNNAVTHADPRSIRVRLDREGSRVVVEVRDDGAGMPVPYRSGLGIASMRRRVEEAGGTFAILPGVPSGTTVRAEFPVES